MAINEQPEGERRKMDNGDKTRRLADHGARLRSIDTHVTYIRKAIDKINGSVQEHTRAITQLQMDVTRIDGHCELEQERIGALASSLAKHKAWTNTKEEKGKDRTLVALGIVIAVLQLGVGAAVIFK